MTERKQSKEMSGSEISENEAQTFTLHSQSGSHYDSAYSWLVCAAMFFCNMVTLGFSYSIGVYYVVFLDVFGHSSGVTAWVYGTAMFIGKSIEKTTEISSCLLS